MPKPSDFFVGVVDFFAVLLPGALLTALIVTWHAGQDRWDLTAAAKDLGESSAVRWIAFFVVAYVAGHLLAAVASMLLDPIYDRLYRDIWQREIKAEKSGKQYDALVESAKTCAERQWSGARDNVRQWAETYVRASNPTAATEIQRVQADSKFFRSLVLVLVAYLLLLLFGEEVVLHNERWTQFGIGCGLLVLASWRFFELRWKATLYVYEYFLQLSNKTVPAPDANQ